MSSFMHDPVMAYVVSEILLLCQHIFVKSLIKITSVNVIVLV